MEYKGYILYFMSEMFRFVITWFCMGKKISLIAAKINSHFFNSTRMVYFNIIDPNKHWRLKEWIQCFKIRLCTLSESKGTKRYYSLWTVWNKQNHLRL